MNPNVGDILTIETFWENPGKRDGELVVGLYELVDGTQWRESLSTLSTGKVDIVLPAESSSVTAVFQWEAWRAGQPNLYLIIDEDFDNPYQAITGINVKQPVSEDEGGSDSQVVMIAAAAAVAAIGLALVMMRNRSDDDYYYEDDDESYYEDDSWEYEDDEEGEDVEDDDDEYEDEEEDDED
tara:strand:- start:34 stop:579 length:546 start_codon:yes stop_codon:yes gene_type:complete